MQDPSLSAPFVPTSVFTGVQPRNHWSATTNAGSPASAWFVSFAGGGLGDNDKTNTNFAWCVRGGMNADVY